MAVVAAVLDQGKDTPDKDDDRSRAKLSAAEVETLEHIWKAAAATDQDAVG